MKRWVQTSVSNRTGQCNFSGQRDNRLSSKSCHGMVRDGILTAFSVTSRDVPRDRNNRKSVERLDEKLFFSFLFFARVRRKKSELLFWKNLFLYNQILFLSSRHFVCVQGQNKSCFFTIETFFYERCFLILMLGIYFLTISWIMIKQLFFL